MTFKMARNNENGSGHIVPVYLFMSIFKHSCWYKYFHIFSVRTYNMANYQMGVKTLQVPMTLFKENREKLIGELKKVQRLDTKAVVLLQGGDNISLYDTDVDYVFRQVSTLCYCRSTGDCLYFTFWYHTWLTFLTWFNLSTIWYCLDPPLLRTGIVIRQRLFERNMFFNNPNLWGSLSMSRWWALNVKEEARADPES